MAADGSTKAVLVAMFANAGIAIAKFVAFAFTGATSMLAEGIHSVADTSNQALLLLGGRRARREATSEHPFGFGRERYFWSFIVALVLFSLGGLFALYEGVDKLRHPHDIESLTWAIGVLAIAILFESAAMRTAIIESNKVRGERSWYAFIRRSKVPELPVILLEDAGALLGLVFALVAVLLTQLTGDPTWDAVGTLAIGALLVIIAVVLAIEMKSLLIGESASAEVRERIEQALRSADHVRELIYFRTLHLGPEQLLVAGKLELEPALTTDEVNAAIDAAEDRVRDAVTLDTLIYLEPDDVPSAGAQ